MSESAEIHPAPSSFIRRHVFSTDHKVIGKQYLAICFILDVHWGADRHSHPLATRLARLTALPGSEWLSEDFWDGESWIAQSLAYGSIESELFNTMFTMHGTIMVFFVAMPLLLGAFGNFSGAIDGRGERHGLSAPQHDVGMDPWLWHLLCSSLASFTVEGGAAASGWTAYPPLSAVPDYTGVDWGQTLVGVGGRA